MFRWPKQRRRIKKGEIDLLEQFKALGLPEPVREYRFAPPRRWRIDYAWPDYGLALEIEGGAWVRGRHTRGGGFSVDMEKYNTLAMLGFRLLRFTPEEAKGGVAADGVREFMSTISGVN